jgi:hypothetical protein
MLCSRTSSVASHNDTTRRQSRKVYLYPKPVDLRKPIDGLVTLVKLDIKVAVFDPVLFVFLNRPPVIE